MAVVYCGRGDLTYYSETLPCILISKVGTYASPVCGAFVAIMLSLRCRVQKLTPHTPDTIKTSSLAFPMISQDFKASLSTRFGLL